MITALVIVLSLILLAFILIYGLFCYVFSHPPKKRPDARHVPDSTLYRDYKKQMLECVEDIENTPCENVSIISSDGLRLCGKLYNIEKNAPLVIFFHGYHGVAAWDGYGLFKLCKKNGINILMTDERAHGDSDGTVISFGINERFDCKRWVEYAVKRFGEKKNIILAGVSMGATSALMSIELGLPDNVKAIISDCGFSEPAAIIMENIKSMKLPIKPIYQFIKFGARLFGHFDLEASTAIKSVKKSIIPILFIQGSKDSVVPISMGLDLYEACMSKKEHILIDGADHANSAMTDYEAYEKVILRFIKQNVI